MLQVLSLLSFAVLGVVAKDPMAYMYTDLKCDVPYDAPNEGKADWSKKANINSNECFTREKDGASVDTRRQAVWMPAGTIAPCLTMFAGDDCVGYSKSIPVAMLGYWPLCYQLEEGIDAEAPDGYASYKFDMDGQCGDTATTPFFQMPNE